MGRSADMQLRIAPFGRQHDPPVDRIAIILVAAVGPVGVIGQRIGAVGKNARLGQHHAGPVLHRKPQPSLEIECVGERRSLHHRAARVADQLVQRLEAIMIAQRDQPCAALIGDEGVDQVDAVVRQLQFQLVAEPAADPAFAAQTQPPQFIGIATRSVRHILGRHQQPGIILDAALGVECHVALGKDRAALPSHRRLRGIRSLGCRRGRRRGLRRRRFRRVQPRFQLIDLRLERRDLRTQGGSILGADRLRRRGRLRQQQGERRTGQQAMDERHGFPPKRRPPI